jgi:hypothetical protein
MSKIRVTDFLPLLVLLVALAALSYSTAASASLFSMPFGSFRLGSWPAADAPGTVATVHKALTPFRDLSLRPGTCMPFWGFSPFATPYQVQRSYKQTIVTPEGPVTRVVDQSYDGRTGDRTTTVTDI